MYTDLEKKIKYKFKNTNFLEQAFTHSSYANEKKLNPVLSNERLEFLGDAVLEIVVSEFLYKNNPEMPEGLLSKYRAACVCEESFSKISKDLKLGNFIMLGRGEEINGGAKRNSILADLFEAMVGAIYLDAGFEETKKIVLNIIKNDIEHYKNTFEIKDYKTILQEVLQAKSKKPIKYVIESESGPSHEKIFNVNLYHSDEKIGFGEGKTKKEAEQNAAKVFLSKNGYI